MKTRRILNVLVIVFALCLALYRLRTIGPLTPITILVAALIAFMAIVCVAISFRRGNVTTSVPAGGNPTNRILGLALLGSIVIFLVLIAGWLGYAASAVQRWQNVEQTWSTTEGVVRAWAIRSSVDGRSGRVTWSPYWTYSFTANGQQFASSSIEIPSGYNAHWYDSSAAAEADALSRPVGSIVPVYYDPERPHHSVLDRRTSDAGERVVWGLCVLLLGVAVLLCWFIFRVATKSRTELRSRLT